MSINPEVDEIVALPIAASPVAPTNGHVVKLMPEAPASTIEASAEPAAAAQSRAKRGRPGWLASAAVGVVGLIASGTLGYLVYSTTHQRDAAQRQLASTQATLTAAQKDAAERKVTSGYVALYVSDSGKVQWDYQNIVACDNYSECRTAAQQLLTDMQTFQSDRKSATVPSDLAGVDADLGDALSAGIAGDQQFISGMDTGDLPKFKEGGHKVDLAMLNIAKAQVTFGKYLA